MEPEGLSFWGSQKVLLYKKKRQTHGKQHPSSLLGMDFLDFLDDMSETSATIMRLDRGWEGGCRHSGNGRAVGCKIPGC